MELRLDRLLAALRDNTADILHAIDTDPILLKRPVGGLVLANASKELFTPLHEHQLYAKGIVYRRDPYRLVSLPLIKIYNLGEKDVTAADLAALQAEGPVRTRFLSKLDGSLVQVFGADGRVWFTTRGMIEGAKPGGGQDDEARERRPGFNYLVAARMLAERRYPQLVNDPGILEGRTLVFELLHPGARNVTDYGGREDLVLLAAFDRPRFRYLPYDDLLAFGQAHRLTVVEALSPRGATLAAQIDDLLTSLAGTDQEGCVLNLERGDEVIYRVKVKSPDYLRLFRLMMECTYDRTVAVLDANPQLRSWADVEEFLKGLGTEQVPEELLPFYREHYESFRAYRDDCERLRAWAAERTRQLEATLGGPAGMEPRAYRKTFAALATNQPHSGLLFAALDGQLTLVRVREYCSTHAEVKAALSAVDPGPR